MWVLGAVKARVIEREEKYILKRKEEEACHRTKIPSALKGCTIDYELADITEVTEDELPSKRFDLAFCKEVLYIVFLDAFENVEGASQHRIEKALLKVQDAINQMARAVKPGGRVIAIETVRLSSNDEPIGDPIPIDHLFEAASLELDEDLLVNAPNGAYCYKRPLQ